MNEPQLVPYPRHASALSRGAGSVLDRVDSLHRMARHDKKVHTALSSRGPPQATRALQGAQGAPTNSCISTTGRSNPAPSQQTDSQDYYPPIRALRGDARHHRPLDPHVDPGGRHRGDEPRPSTRELPDFYSTQEIGR